MTSRRKPLKEEMVSFLKFVAEKTRDIVDYPLIVDWIRQYQAEHGSLVNAHAFNNRLTWCRNRTSEIEEFDDETKVRVMYALSAQLDASFLEKLRNQADVEVDHQNRIILYKKHGGGLDLCGEHRTRVTVDRTSGILEFLAKEAGTANTPMSDSCFLKKFKRSTNCRDTLQALHKKYKTAKNQIYQSTNFDRNTKVAMMFISSMRVPQSVLEELRKDANVIVNGEGRITKYTATDGSLELRSSSRTTVDWWRKTCKNFDEDYSEDDANDEEKERIHLMKFLIKETDKDTPPASISQLARDFSNEEHGSIAKMHRALNQMRTFRQHIPQMERIDMDTKVKLMFALNGSVTENFLKELRKDADVEIDESDRIISYKSKDGNLNLEERATQAPNTSSSSVRRRGRPKRRSAVVQEPEIEQDEILVEDEDDEIPPKRRRLRRTVSDYVNTGEPIPEYQVDEMEDVKHPIGVYASARIGNCSTSRNIQRGGMEDFGNFNNFPTSSGMHTRAVKEEPNIALESEEILSLNEFLDRFKRSVSTLYASELVNMKLRMEEMLKNEDRTILTPVVHQFLVGYLHNLTTARGISYGEEESTSLPNVLYHLGVQMCFIAHPLTNRFQKDLRRRIQDHDNQTIPFARIRYALEMALDAIDLWNHENQ